jgi:hypothetical protein
MHAERTLAMFLTGLAGGAALMLSAPSAASDPPAKARPAHGQASGHDAHGPSGHAAQTVAVPGPEIGFRGCAYFEDAGFGGRRGDVREGANVEWIGAAWNDRVSSVACADQCRLIGYEHINFGGMRRNFTGAVAEAGTGWDDRISALRVVCAADAAHGQRHEPAAPEPH